MRVWFGEAGFARSFIYGNRAAKRPWRHRTQRATAQGAGLARLYRARFSSTDIAKKEKVWAILCDDFFSRFVNPGDRVLEIAAGYCEFINHIKCGEKVAYDANPDTVAYAAKDVKVVIGDCRNMSELGPNTSTWHLPATSLSIWKANTTWTWCSRRPGTAFVRAGDCWCSSLTSGISARATGIFTIT